MFNDMSSAALQVALGGLVARQRSIANNVANIQTPGYQATTVAFEGALASALKQGTPLDRVPVTSATSLAPTRLDGNNVNLDEQTLSNVETTLRYQLVLRALDAHFTDLHTAIKG